MICLVASSTASLNTLSKLSYTSIVLLDSTSTETFRPKQQVIDFFYNNQREKTSLKKKAVLM